MEKIILNSARGIVNKDENQFIATNLIGSNKLLPSSDLLTVINAKEQYDIERSNSNLIRLSCNINTVCSNILFNVFTEIIKDEGSDYATCLNFDGFPKSDENNIIFKKSNAFDSNNIDRVYNAIDDTQLSNNKCGYKYHCGMDFFNNHRLRSLSFKTVNGYSSNTITDDNFNTIQDFHRTHLGETLHDNYVIGERDLSNEKLHLYNSDNILSFKDCFNEKLKEENGWFGFINASKIDTYYYDNNDIKQFKLDISKPINYERSCSFIDMYPDRTLFSFVPKYNSFRYRIEKNWNYCLTYPSSSTTENIPFINSDIKGGALRIFLLDDTLNSTFKVYCMSKHGVQEGDYVNVYSGSTLIIPSIQVSSIENEYNFYLGKNGLSLNTIWSEVTYDDSYEVNGYTSYKIKKGDKFYQNKDTNFLTFSFKKIDGGNEVDYYVRIFSKIPNWRFADKKINNYVIYEKDKTLIERYSSGNYLNGDVFENTLSKLAFSKNIYNDPISQVIFTDDIVVDYLKDNLNRPITDFYFTIIKNNKGYRKWYKEKKVNTSDVEFSHCFGKVTCGFYLNDLMYDINKTKDKDSLAYPLSNSRLLSNNNFLTTHEDSQFSGLSIYNINKKYRSENDDMDEINYYKNLNFYGDLCYYSNNNCKEVVIQNIDYRFNTVQRENWGTTEKLTYCDIQYDDYDENKFSDNFIDKKYVNLGNLLEGYYYNPHTKISFNTLSRDLETAYPKIYSIRKKEMIGQNKFFIITDKNNYFEKNDYFSIYDKNNLTLLKCQITEILNYKSFNFSILTDNDENIINNFINGNINEFKIINKTISIPSYANMLMDGTCRYAWRTVYKNGFDKINENNIEVYPFTNGRFYINKNINLYLRRQNPNNDTILTNVAYDEFTIKGKFIDNSKINNYYLSDNIIC